MLDPAVTGVIIAYNLAGNFVFVHGYDPAIDPLESFTPERCRALVAAAIGDPSVEITVHAANPWIMAAQVADRYRVGRVFLAGDAAHRFPPTGGLGLNTGLGDVHNLAWKIAAVRAGRYDDALLDSYEAERRPVALANTAQSLVNARLVDRLFEAVRGTKRGVAPSQTYAERMADPLVRAALMDSIAAQQPHFDSLALQLGYIYGEGDAPPPDVSHFEPAFRRGARLPHAWVERQGLRGSTLDLIDPNGFTLLVGAGAQAWRATAPASLRVLVLGSDFSAPETWAGPAGLLAGGALLVRPDGHIALAAISACAAAEDLAEALAHPAIVTAARSIAAA